MSGQSLRPAAGHSSGLLISSPLFFFLIPVIGVSLASALLQEPVTEMILLVVALIAGGILTVQLGHRREAAGPLR